MHWTRIEERTLGDVTVLRLEGHLTLGAEDRSLRDMIDYLIALKRAKVVLDLQLVPFIDSLGVGEIVRAYSAVVRAGGSLKLARVSPRVHEILITTQLTKVLAIFESVERAALSFSVAALRRSRDGRSSGPVHD
jgi:anti-sigma B factor antagonist